MMDVPLENDAGEGSSMPRLTSNDEERALLAPYSYLCKVLFEFCEEKIHADLQAPGKQVRQKLAFAINHWLKIDNERLTAVGEVIQMLHNASLM